MVFILKQAAGEPCLKNLCCNVFKRLSSNRVRVQKPREPHPERMKYLIITRPMYEPNPEDALPQSMKCRVKLERVRPERKKEDNPYLRLMGEKIYKEWDDAKMILVFHHYSMTWDDHYKNEVLFYRKGMMYKHYTKRVVHAGLENTRFSNLLPIYTPFTAYVVSPEEKLAAALQLFKKMPNIVLMAGVIDNRILSYAEMQKYVQIGNITTARAELVSTLNSAGQSLVNNTTSLQQNLVSLLDQHISILKESALSESKTGHGEGIATSATDASGNPLTSMAGNVESNDAQSGRSEPKAASENSAASKEATSSGDQSATSKVEVKTEQKDSSTESNDDSSSSSDSDSDSDSDSESKKK